MKTSQRWWISFPFIIALVSLGFIGWSAIQIVVYPDDGIPSISPTNRIIEIDPSGPAFNKLKVGDTIKSVNGIPMTEDVNFYANKRAGDVIHFIIDRSGQEKQVDINLRDPPLSLIINRLVPLIIGLIFWLVGVSVQAYKPSNEPTTMFFLFSQASAVLLTAGMVSPIGLAWTSSLFNLLLWMIGPISVHFHLHFPRTSLIRARRLLVISLYTIGIVGGFPYLIWVPQAVRASPWYPEYYSANRLFLAINLLIVVALLFYSYRHATESGVRGKIRIVVLGGALGALPLVTLTFLPDAFLQKPIISPAFGFLFLGILPLTYGYAIFRHHLIEIESHVNRGATYIFVYSILGGFYLVLYSLMHRLISISLVAEPLLNTILVLVLASVFVPLRQRVQRIVDSAFYGGWYDYRSAVTQITQGLEQITELRRLAETISDRLAHTLRLEDTCVFLRDLAGDFSVIEVAPRTRLNNQPPMSFPPLPRTSLSYLLNIGEAVSISALRNALSEVALSPEELQLLNSEQVHLWVPIIGHGQVQGLIALGPKFGGDTFSGEDMDILRVVAWQISTVMENIQLLTRLRQHAADLEQRVEERTAELHDAKERVEAILASVGDGVIVTDLDSSIITVNSAFEGQLGHKAVELIGQKLDDLITPNNDPVILKEMHLTLERGEVWSGEIINQRKGAKTQNDIQLTMAPVRDQSGKIVGYVGSQRDITQQRELDRLKDQFISDVSHELRTPATNLSLYLELLERATPEKYSEYLNVLKGQNRLLVKLVEDILDLSRLSIGRAKKFELEAVDLNLLTEQVVTAHIPLAEASGLNLEFQRREGLPQVLGEQNQLARVVTNLVSNAVRYTLEGSVCVRIYPNNNQVCLEVQDSGIGIDPEDIPHLFERFYRGRQVRQSKIHGTGLGLAIVKEIVDLHEGYVTVDSEVGKGSTFRVWLPVFNGLTESY